MKRLLLLMPDSTTEVDTELTALGQLGVMHVTPFQPAKDESIERVYARIKQLEKAISILDQYDGEVQAESDLIDITDYAKLDRGEILLLEKVLDAESSLNRLTKTKNRLRNELEWYSNWGNIVPGDIEKLKEKGIWIKLYLLEDKDLKKISKREDIQVLGKLDDLNQVVLISEDPNEKLNSPEVDLPLSTVEDTKISLEDTNQKLGDNKKLLLQFHAQKQVLRDGLNERKRRFDVRNIQYGGIAIEEQVRCWKGYIPEDAVDRFTKAADKYRWGYVIDEPLPDEIDEVPTLVRTSRWAKSIQPVLDFMGLVPGYNEMDVSKVFMIFFTFFTGILVGDAGYGIVFLLLTFLVHRKQKFVKKIEFSLMYTLSVSIMFWGILTGTYFGAEVIADIPILSQLKVKQLASFGGDTIFVQKFMFLVGAIHLTVGHLQTAWKYINTVRAIAQLGWVAIVWGLYLVVNQMVLGIPAPEIMVWLFIVGAILVALFSNPGSSFIKGVISSLGSLPLSIISGFSDIISYIRLYAVGLSTVLMATSFNQMAIGDGISTVLSGIGAVLVLILGHGLNMILAGMAVIVHGVRLNMLEYAGHAGVEFSGNEYNPFRLK